METKDLSQDYIEGFNKGYVLREHKPNLALSLSHTKFPETEKDFQSGLLHGIETREDELRKEKAKDFSFDNLKEEYKDELEVDKKNQKPNKDIDKD